MAKKKTVAQRQEMVIGTLALAFRNGSSYVSRAAAPERTGGDKVL